MDIDVVDHFERLCKSNPDKSEAVAAIEVLAKVLKYSDVSTIQGLHDIMNEAISKMWKNQFSNISVKSACELFERFITLATLDTIDFNHCKMVLCDRAHIFIQKVGLCRQHISENFSNYISNGAKIFLHSYSRVVLAALAYATKSSNDRKKIHCYVTTSMPSGSGAKMTKALSKLKIPCTLVPDTAIAYLMPQVDFVVLGAEAVVESGGILNVLGSSLIAMTASVFSRPVYVLAESFKFIRCYPLDQNHIPDSFKWPDCDLSTANSINDSSSHRGSPLENLRIEHGICRQTAEGRQDEEDSDEGFRELHSNWNMVMKERVSIIEQKMPRVDYTSPSYITYLFTDLGVLTPSAVSDELIKLYL